MTRPDFLIVGGGTAGAVLAARLSEVKGLRIVLVEAGADLLPDSTPPDVDDLFPASYLNPDYFWPGLNASTLAGSNPRPYLQARIMGGGSSINGMISLRGGPSDYESWVAAGASGHAWCDLVPYFERSERDLDFSHPSGVAGTIPISRLPRRTWPAFIQELEQEAHLAGFPSVANINAAPQDGFFAIPTASDRVTRSSTARCYLTEAVRRRPNLTILPGTVVMKLHVQDGSVTMVEADRNGERVMLTAREIIVSAGAVFSPALLLRSGIGPPNELRAAGIVPTVDRPGVGKNLQNHCYINYALTLPPGRRGDARQRQFAIAGLRASSKRPGRPPGDLLVSAMGRVSGRNSGVNFALVGSSLFHSFSRGTVTIARENQLFAPRVDFRLLEDPRDEECFLLGARLTERLLKAQAVAATYNDAYLMPGRFSARQFGKPGWLGQLSDWAAQAASNMPTPFRRACLAVGLKGSRRLHQRHEVSNIRDRDILEAVCPTGHPVGTCAMGRESDPSAVTGSNYRVHGIRNLRVVDASVMPVIPTANTNLPTLMIAERAADVIRRDTLKNG